jgi:hypothetical protein
MKSLCGFGSEISDRVVPGTRASRDIVLCRLQAVQEGEESVAESGPRVCRCSLSELANGRYMLQEELPALTIELVGCR